MQKKYLVPIQAILSLVFSLIIIFSIGCGSSGSNSSSPPHIPPPQQQPEPAPPPQPKALPDLVILSGKMEPSASVVSPGTKLRFTFQVHNRGKGEVPSNNFISVSGPGIGGGISGGLKPGETKPVTLDFQVHSKGATFGNIIYSIDPDNVIKESDENNNDSQRFSVKTTH